MLGPCAIVRAGVPDCKVLGAGTVVLRSGSSVSGLHQLQVGQAIGPVAGAPPMYIDGSGGELYRLNCSGTVVFRSTSMAIAQLIDVVLWPTTQFITTRKRAAVPPRALIARAAQSFSFN